MFAFRAAKPVHLLLLAGAGMALGTIFLYLLSRCPCGDSLTALAGKQITGWDPDTTPGFLQLTHLLYLHGRFWIIACFLITAPAFGTISSLYALVIGFRQGLLCVLLTLCLHTRGFLLWLCLSLPQGPLYALSFLILSARGFHLADHARPDPRHYLLRSAMLELGAILAQAYLNPWLVRLLL